MFDSNGSVGSVYVETTNGRGFTAEEWTERLLNKLIHISDSAPPVIKEQAIAFRDAMRPAILYYMKQAISSDRTTLSFKLKEAGHIDVADLIVKL